MNQVFFSIGANLLSKGGLLLINLISAKTLLVQNYGILSYILTLIGVTSSFVLAGSGISVNVVSAQNQENKSRVNNFITFSILLAFLISPVACYVALSLNPTTEETIEYIFFYMLIITLLYSVNCINDSAFVGNKKYKELFLVAILVFFINMPFFYLLVKKYELYGALISIFLYRFSYLLIINYFNFKNKIFTLDFKNNFKNSFNISTFKKLSLPSFISGITLMPALAIGFSFLTNLENGFEKLAYFMIVYQIYLVAVFIPSSLNGFYISKFSSERNKSDMYYIAKINILFSGLVASILYLTQGAFWYYLDENYYKNSSDSFNIMLIVIVLYSLSTVFSSYWPSIGKAWIGACMNITWALSFILVGYILNGIYDYGQIGLAYAFLVAYIVLLLTQLSVYTLSKNGKKL
jgi:O-antigen/teichoic acid export membrane protein